MVAMSTWLQHSNSTAGDAHMSKQIPAITFILAALLLAGCVGDRVTGASDDRAAARSTVNSVQVDRPFAGDCVLTSRGLIFTSPTTATQIVDGTCNLTHLGRNTVLITENVDFTVLSYSSIAIFTAANGDELHTTLNGFATPSPTGLNLAGTMLVTGGTGRFTNASGSAVHSGLVASTATYHLEGRLVY